jgi:uncharacterized integral membrane protein (TIGR00698 family)
MTSLTHHDAPSHRPSPSLIAARLPGIALTLGVTVVAYALEAGETALFGKAWLEALVLAILIGTVVGSLWHPGHVWHCGVSFSAKYPLEIAVVLLGASVSAATIFAVGPLLLVGIAGVVALAIPMSFAIGRMLGLPTRMALLVACGNSICGNSAIAAVAPVIGADSEDVAASIAFTAVFGVIVVLGLPVVGFGLGLSGLAFGTLAGLTVYAVPQVIAAAAPLGATAIQMGTLVKLVRVLMLGPVCLVLSFIAPKMPRATIHHGDVSLEEPATAPSMPVMPAHPSLTKLVPWFILGFLGLVVCRSAGLIPDAIVPAINHIATLLTVVSMAALGLGVDVRTVASAGGRVTAAVVLSLAMLIAVSFALIIGLGMM